MNTLKKFARDTDCTQIQWQTPEENERAINFYYKQKAMSKNKKRFFLSL